MDRVAGRSPGAGPITRFDASGYSTRFACEVKDLDVDAFIDRKSARRMDRCTQLVLAAARQAEADSGLAVGRVAERAGAAIATAIGGVSSFEECVLQIERRGPERVSPFSIVQTLPNLAAGWVSIELGTRGPLVSECTACAASNMALGDGLDAIRLGRADVMFCGGTEAPITPVGLAGFGAMRALSVRNGDPEAASRPFDAGRDGFVIAEGAAVLVLEELSHAQARGATIHAEVAGYGISSDANHVSDPDPSGENPARALRMAFADAGITAEDVGYVNAHGTSTPAGDAGESRVLKLALGEEKASPNAGLLDQGSNRPHPWCRGRGRSGVHDPRASSRDSAADPQPDRSRSGVRPRLRCEHRATATGRGRVSNSFGFGGHNTAVVFRRWAA